MTAVERLTDAADLLATTLEDPHAAKLPPELLQRVDAAARRTTPLLKALTAEVDAALVAVALQRRPAVYVPQRDRQFGD